MNKARSLLTSVLGAALKVGITSLGRRRLSQTSGTLRLPDLRAPVEVIRDRWGVPHIYAGDAHDLLFAQGFVHAQDRLFQMDMQRRLVAGRLSEVSGRATVAVDRWIRILSMRHVAEQEVPLLDHEARDEVEAYCAGVNAYIEQAQRERKLPVEFTLLRYRPEPWTAADTLSWAKFLAWVLSINWETEIIRARLVDLVGPEVVAELEPDYLLFERWPTIVPPGVDYSRIGESALAAARDTMQFTGPQADEGVGSNSWALSGERTTGGKPLLANDMHLSIALPAIWYQNHLSGGGVDVTGVSLPGIPYVVAGHNGSVAWGFTYGFADVQDLYIERLRGGPPGSGVLCEHEGRWEPATVRHEIVKVRRGRGFKTVKQRVITTRHGPVINSLAASLAGEQPLAMRWTSLEPGVNVRAIRSMNRARDCAQFRDALRDWSDPVVNVVYVDTGGNIAYTLAGKIPIRANGDGRLPVPGWMGDYEWAGYIPFDDLPHMWNPPDGQIVTANNRVAPVDYPYFISHEYAGGDRAERITELLRERERSDVAWSKRVQFDQHSPSAREVREYLVQLKTDDPELQQVLDLFGEWDGTISADSAAAAVYELLWFELLERIPATKLGRMAPHYSGKGVTPGLSALSLFGLRALEWLLRQMATPRSPWFDLGRGESRDEALLLCLRAVVDRLKEQLGSEPSTWRWGDVHKVTFGHPLGSVDVLAPALNRGPFPIGGDITTVWAAIALPGSEGMLGPPYRFVVDLSDLRNSAATLAPGQSGKPGSRHYDDGIEGWLNGGYHPMLYAREDVEREAEATLSLRPN